jgi:hypothetical protein
LLHLKTKFPEFQFCGGPAFGYSPYVMQFLREGGTNGIAKVAALLLAA